MRAFRRFLQTWCMIYLIVSVVVFILIHFMWLDQNQRYDQLFPDLYKQPSFISSNSLETILQNIQKAKSSVLEQPEVPLDTLQKEGAQEGIQNDQEINRLVPGDTGSANKVLSDAKIAIILGYMRTGSSFTGSTISQHPGTFYLFEPIRDIWEAFWIQYRTPKDGIISHSNGTTRVYKASEAYEVILQEVVNFLSCNFKDLSIPSLINSFHVTRGLDDLRKCTLEQTLYDRKNLKNVDKWSQCAEKARQACLNSPLRLFKFIRLEMSMVRTLLQLFPNLKVLHLNRDPRAIFNSRAHTGDAPQQAEMQDVKLHCRQWIEDLEVGATLAREYPDAIRVVQYEDIAEKPNDAFREIFDFFGISFTTAIGQYIHALTRSKAHEGRWTINRRNSALTAKKWRSDMVISWAKTVYTECKRGNEILYYLPFEDQSSLRDMSLPSRDRRKSSSVLFSL